MIIRYMSSAGIGILVTTALLWSMNALIDMGNPVTTTPPEIRLPQWIRNVEDTPVEETVKPPQRVVDPPEVPEHLPPVEFTGDTIPIRFSVSPTAPTSPTATTGLSGNIDSGLINIITGQAEYPVIASQKGLEGYVIVRFDVTEFGTVENVQVIESSNPVFNKAAIKAAYRSKYKPKTVDGLSYGTPGLRKLFRFEMKAG